MLNQEGGWGAAEGRVCGPTHVAACHVWPCLQASNVAFRLNVPDTVGFGAIWYSTMCMGVYICN
jgi:hypothetical protein